MKKPIPILLLFSFILHVASAQPYGRGMGPASADDLAARNTDFMFSHLELSEDQQPLVDSINSVYAERMMAVRQDHRGDRDAMMEEARKVRIAHTNALEGVLSAQQMDRLQEARGARRNQCLGRGGGRGPQARGRSRIW